MFNIAGLIQALFGRHQSEEGVHSFRSATQMLQALPESDLLLAQVEIIKSVQELNKNEKIPLKERFKTIPYIDEKARRLQAHLIGVYQGKILDKGAPLPQVLVTITSFWHHMGNAYQQCLKQAMQSRRRVSDLPLELFALRSMTYFLEHAQWGYLRYLEIDSLTWRYINRLYLFAEQQGFADHEFDTYADTPPTTLRREYLKILMLSLSRPESLQRGQAAVVRQWLDRWIDTVPLEALIRPHRHLFAVNLAGSSGARRLRRDMAGEHWRYWFTGTLTEQMSLAHTQISQGATPASLGLPAETARPANLDLLLALSQRWSRESPVPARKEERHSAHKPIKVIRGLESIIRYLRRQPSQNVTLEPQTGFQVTQWQLEDESAGGLGVRFHCSNDLKLRAGELVAIPNPDQSKPLTVGIVRRISNRKDGRVSAGIETVTESPILVELACIHPVRQRTPAIFAPENPRRNQGRFLLMPQNCFGEQREYTLAARTKAYRIRLAPAREFTLNTAVANFAVLAKLAD